jgi:hypothetical protein
VPILVHVLAFLIPKTSNRTTKVSRSVYRNLRTTKPSLRPNRPPRPLRVAMKSPLKNPLLLRRLFPRKPVDVQRSQS